MGLGVGEEEDMAEDMALLSEVTLKLSGICFPVLGAGPRAPT